MSNTLTNLYAADGLIVARLRQVVVPRYPALKVESATSFADAEVAAWPAPALYVIMGSYAVTDQRGEHFTLEQDWGIACMVNNTADVETGREAKDEAGQYMIAVLEALQNWIPAGETFSPLRLQPADPPNFMPGRAIFYLSFSTAAEVKGCPDCDPDEP